ncbi:MAG TPA: preprotein translocase subunit SecY [Candidatus Babeliales bacterium]|nr:preprotein translocase subunit SecY [Candidatus Babeliales bacterium]
MRRKLFFVLGVLVVYRIGSILPVLGVNVQALAAYMQQATNLGTMFSYLDTFSGSAFGKCTLFALGISPYITASIMMQLLGMTVPSLEQLLKEGEFGRKVFNQYTRYLTLGLSLVYATSYAAFLESQGLALSGGFGFRIPFILSLTAGALFVMWLGEQISVYGIGNGASVIIFAGIVARFPDYIVKTYSYVEMGTLGLVTALLIWAFFLLIMACVVYVEKGERKIPVQYARRVVGNKIYAAQSTYIPFKVNAVGVMPVIFASSMLQMPMYIIGMLASYFPALKFLPERFAVGGAMYNVLTFALILFFTYFYTALIFDPNKLAQDMKKSGGFILGLRPGKKTADFFDYILNRLGLIGALYLAFLAILPNLLPAIVTMPFYLGGTSLLIVVGVALEFSSQIEAYLIEHRYEGFLVSGRLKAR